MSYQITITRRVDNGVQTTGEFKLVSSLGTLSGFTLELPWKDNQNNLSCIPKGSYKLELFNSVKFGKCLHVLNVQGRDGILIHKGNYNRDTHGCILPGGQLIDINKDRQLDVTGSGAMVDKILSLWDGDGELIII